MSGLVVKRRASSDVTRALASFAEGCAAYHGEDRQRGRGLPLSVTENIDTTTPAGRMMMQTVGAFAEFERAMIRERTSAGLAAARARGHRRAAQEAGRDQASRNRRECRLGPEVWSRDGAALQHQPANRIANYRRA